jgi:AcrR family transcriptional regulator
MSKKKTAASGKSYGIKADSNRGITIGQLINSVSKLTGQRCTPAMIYNYEKKGLIQAPARTEGGFRLFRVQDIHQVICIKNLQATGLSLEEIQNRLESCTEDLDLEVRDLQLPADRRMKILEAAAAIFPQKGYSATTIQDISQAAGISTSAIYQYFRNKEELFIALTDNLSFIPILDEVNVSLDQAKDIRYEDVRRTLINVGEGFLTTHVHNIEIVRMFIAEARNFPEVGKRYSERLVIPVEKLLQTYLSAQIKRGVLRPVNVELAAQIFYGMIINFIITRELLMGEKITKIPTQDRITQCVDIYLMGLFNPLPGQNASQIET